MPRQSIGAVSMSAKRLRCQRSYLKLRALGSFSRFTHRPQVSSTTEKSCEGRLRHPMPPISLLRNVTYQLQERRLKPLEQGRLRSCKKSAIIGSKKRRLTTQRPRLLSRHPQIELGEKQSAPSTSLIEQQKPHGTIRQSETSTIYSSIESDACGHDGLNGYPKSDLILRTASLPCAPFLSAQFPIQLEERSGSHAPDHGGATRWNNDLCVSNGPLPGHLPELVTDAPSSMPPKNSLATRRRGSSHRIEHATKNMANSTSKKRRLSKAMQPSDSFNSVNASRWSGYRGAQPMGSASFALGAIPCTSEIRGHGPNLFGHTMRGATVGLLGRNAPYLTNGVGFLDNCRFCHRQIVRKGQSRPRICLQCEKKKATPIHDRCKDCKEPIVRSNVRKARICQKCKKHREKARSVYPVGLSAAMMPLSYSQGGTQSYENSNAGYLGAPVVTPLASLVSPNFTISHPSGMHQRLPTSLVNSRRVYAVNNYLYWLQVLSQTAPVVSPLCYTSSPSFQTQQFSDHGPLSSHSHSNALHNKSSQFIPPPNEENRSSFSLQLSGIRHQSEDRSLGEHHASFQFSSNAGSPSNHTDASAGLSSKESIHSTRESTLEGNGMFIRKGHVELGQNNDHHGVPRNVLLHNLDQYSSRVLCSNSSAHPREALPVAQDYRGGVPDFPNAHSDFVPCMASASGHLIVPSYSSNLSNREEILNQNPQHLNILSAQDTPMGRSTGSPLAPQLYSYLRKIATEEFSTPEEIVEHLRSRWKKSRNMTSVTLYNVPSGSNFLETPQERNGNSAGPAISFKATGPILIPQINPYTLLHHLAVHEHRQQQQDHLHWKLINQHQSHNTRLPQSEGFSGAPVAQVSHRLLEARPRESQYTQGNNEVTLNYSDAHGPHPDILPSVSSLVLLESAMLNTVPVNEVTVETKNFASKHQTSQTSSLFGNVLNNDAHGAIFTSESSTEAASAGHIAPLNTLHSTPPPEESSAPCPSSEFPVNKMHHQEIKTTACNAPDDLLNLSSEPLEIGRKQKRARCLSDAPNSENCPSWVLSQGEMDQCLGSSNKATSSKSHINIQKSFGEPDPCSLLVPKEKDSCNIPGVKSSPLECLSSSRCLSPILNENKSCICTNLSLDTPADEEFIEVCVASQSSGDERSPTALYTQSQRTLCGGKNKNSCNDSCSDTSSGMKTNRTSFKIKPNDVMSSQVSSEDTNWVANTQPPPGDALCRPSADPRGGSTMAPLHLFAALFLSSLVGESTTSQNSILANAKQEKIVNDFPCISRGASLKKSNTQRVSVIQLKEEKEEKREEDASVSCVSDTAFFYNVSNFSSLSVECGPTANQTVAGTTIQSAQYSVNSSLCSTYGKLQRIELQDTCRLVTSTATEQSTPREKISQLQRLSRTTEAPVFSSHASFASVSASTPAISCHSNATLPTQPVVFSGNTCGARKKRVLKGVSPRRLVVASSV